MSGRKNNPKKNQYSKKNKVPKPTQKWKKPSEFTPPPPPSGMGRRISGDQTRIVQI